jgi:hypothetical protein
MNECAVRFDVLLTVLWGLQLRLVQGRGDAADL